jgi:protein TonB
VGVLRIRNSFSFSVLLHALAIVIAGMLLVESRQRQSATPPKYTVIELEPLPKVQSQAPTQRVVQTLPGQLTDHAAKDSFLGEKTQTVDRQTVSKDKLTSVGKAAKAKTQSETPAAPVKQELSQLGLQIIPKLMKQTPVDPRADRISKYQNENQEGGVPKEYIKGLKEGETTALNTREFAFFGYFQRIRTSLDHAWNQSLKDQLTRYYYKGRSLASNADHTTQLMVTLDKIGEIKRIQILSESGTQDLDDAAVKAFNQAGPFPNPPRGILDSTGQILIRWEFILRT